MKNSKGTPSVLVAFSTSKRLYARLLRWITKSKFQHSFLFIYLEKIGGWSAIDIDKSGVHIIGTKKALSNVSEFECFSSEIDLRVGIAKANELLGSGYDRKGLFFGLIFTILKRLFGYVPKEPIHSANKLYCIEYVATVLKLSGVEPYTNANPAAIPPAEHYRTVSWNDNFNRYEISKEELLNNAREQKEG